MPIAFPPYSMNSMLTNVTALSAKPFFVVPAPNMGAPNLPYKPFQTDLGNANNNINLINLGKTFADVTNNARPNPVVTSISDRLLTDRRVYDRVEASLNMILSGVSRDAAGVALGACQVLIFRTEDKTLVDETISDASGNWSISLMKGGPFFLVEYKTGTPVFGTSVNTLVPLQV